jgi:hypothetical protein
VKTYENIGDTNLTTSIYYYIQEKFGKYLRWDGNNGGSSFKKGLYFDVELRDDYRKEWYLFNLEVSQNNKTFIRNAKSGFLLYEDSYLDNFVRKNYIYLQDSITNASVSGSFEFKLMKTKNESWFNIKVDNGWNRYLTSNSQFRDVEQSIYFDDIYAIDSTLNESQSAEIMFIKAQNQSISTDDYILGTPLTTNTYYCIQTITDKNETVFLKWDGIQYDNYWDLNLHKLNDDQCPYGDKYFFELELKYGYNPNILIMKNKASNEYISIFKDNSFALAHDTREKDSYYDNTLTFIVSYNSNLTMNSV